MVHELLNLGRFSMLEKLLASTDGNLAAQIVILKIWLGEY